MTNEEIYTKLANAIKKDDSIEKDPLLLEQLKEYSEENLIELAVIFVQNGLDIGLEISETIPYIVELGIPEDKAEELAAMVEEYLGEEF